MTLGEQIKQAEALDAEIDDLEKQLKDLKQTSATNWRHIWDRMEAEDTDGAKVGNTNYGKQTSRYGVVQDKTAFIRWAQENKPELIQPKPRQALINQLVDKILDDGGTLPPGLGWWEKPWVSRRSR